MIDKLLSRSHCVAAIIAVGLFLASATSPATAQPATAATRAAAPATTPVFSTPYMSEGPPSSEQARVVYYRVRSTSGSMFSVAGERGEGANVYVDGEFQTALLPGGFSSFCVAAGSHRLGAFVGDAPGYRGKTAGAPLRLDGGTTYFFRVRSDKSSPAVPVPRAEAEAELQQSRRQNHVISRASSVVPCREPAAQVAQSAPVAAPAVRAEVSTAAGRALQAEVQFAFARSDIPELPARHPLMRFIEQFQRENIAGASIEVIGYADAIGTDASAERLGLARAESVRALLVRRGVPAANIRTRSSGNTAPVVRGCAATDLSSRIICNTPNRRAVVLRVSRD